MECSFCNKGAGVSCKFCGRSSCNRKGCPKIIKVRGAWECEIADKICKSKRSPKKKEQTTGRPTRAKITRIRPRRVPLNCPDCGGPIVDAEGFLTCPVCGFSQEAP